PRRRDHRRGRSPAAGGRCSRPVPARPPLAHHPWPRKRRPLASRPTPLPLGHEPHPARRAHPTTVHPRSLMGLILFHLRTLTRGRNTPPDLRTTRPRTAHHPLPGHPRTRLPPHRRRPGHPLTGRGRQRPHSPTP